VETSVIAVLAHASGQGGASWNSSEQTKFAIPNCEQSRVLANPATAGEYGKPILST